MDQRQSDRHRAVAQIGQGTWNIEQTPIEAAVAALRCGIELGMTHIDTAELYGSGQAERAIAKAMAGRRAEIFLVSKVLPSNASRKGVVTACEASLARLGTDRLDCYLLHWRGSQPLAQTVAAFEQLIRDGKILSWGVSNFAVDDLEEVYGLSASHPPACNQVLYHLEERACRTCRDPLVCGSSDRRVGYSPFGSQVRISLSAVCRRPRSATDSRAAWRHRASGRATLPAAKSRRLRHSEGIDDGPRS